jgi:hypothetical protein
MEADLGVVNTALGTDVSSLTSSGINAGIAQANAVLGAVATPAAIAYAAGEVQATPDTTPLPAGLNQITPAQQAAVTATPATGTNLLTAGGQATPGTASAGAGGAATGAVAAAASLISLPVIIAIGAGLILAYLLYEGLKSSGKTPLKSEV